MKKIVLWVGGVPLAVFFALAAAGAIWEAVDPEGFEREHAKTVAHEQARRELASARAEARKQARAEERAARTVYASASELAAKYRENPVAFRAEYRGKRAVVSGRIDAISEGVFGGVTVTLDGGRSFVFAQMSAPESVVGLRVGGRAVLSCEGVTGDAGAVILRKCEA